MSSEEVDEIINLVENVFGGYIYYEGMVEVFSINIKINIILKI